MPKKRDDAKPNEKAIQLYSLLLLSGRRHFLGDLAERLHCSKQTVMRLVGDIRAANVGTVEEGIEGRRRWYQLETPAERPKAALAPEEVQHLLLCRDLVAHLLPPDLRDEVERSVGFATALLPRGAERARATTPVASSFPRGRIDYAAFREVLGHLLEAVSERRLCWVPQRRPQ